MKFSWLALTPPFLLFAAPVSAQEASSPPVPASKPPVQTVSFVDMQRDPANVEPARRWYGWQLLISDGVSISLLAAGFSEHIRESGASGPFVAASLSVAALGGPVIHLAHGRWGAALGSLGLRVGSALLGAVVGGVVASGGASNPDADVPPGLVGGIFGFGFGAILGMGLDDALLAWERVPIDGGQDASMTHARPPNASGAPLISLVPIAGPRQSGMGVVGTF